MVRVLGTFLECNIYVFLYFLYFPSCSLEAFVVRVLSTFLECNIVELLTKVFSLPKSPVFWLFGEGLSRRNLP